MREEVFESKPLNVGFWMSVRASIQELFPRILNLESQKTLESLQSLLKPPEMQSLNKEVDRTKIYETKCDSFFKAVHWQKPLRNMFHIQLTSVVLSITLPFQKHL